MKRMLAGMVLAAGCALGWAAAAEDGWLTDFEAAKKQAAATNKAVLLDFTGSDWCGWCIKLDEEVFSKKEFLDFARKHLVLVKIDFPRKRELPPEELERNAALAKQFEVEGFPTVILTDATGRRFARTGYREGGVAPYLEHLGELLERKDLD